MADLEHFATVTTDAGDLRVCLTDDKVVLQLHGLVEINPDDQLFGYGRGFVEVDAAAIGQVILDAATELRNRRLRAMSDG